MLELIQNGSSVASAPGEGSIEEGLSRGGLIAMMFVEAHPVGAPVATPPGVDESSDTCVRSGDDVSAERERRPR
jgi:hypothetical protein